MGENRRVYVFGPFRLDVAKRQLRHGSEPVKLFPKEFDTLLALVERSGAVVEKDELLRAVWPDAAVEEGNLTTHVSHLRKLLRGTGGPHDYIATVPGRGYQFVAVVHELVDEGVERHGTQRPTDGTPIRRDPRRSVRLVAAGLALASLAAIAALVVFSSRRPGSPPPSFHQLTFRRGTIWSARFAPDGQTIVYGAAWDGRAIQLFSTLPGGPESRSLGHDADVLSISASGEMAIALGRRFARLWERSGTLARLSLAGGAPREILDDVKDADWSPDGTSLAIARRIKGRDRLEFPIGKVLHDAQGFIICPRVSRQGDAVAFLERRSGGESVELITRSGENTTLASGQNGETGLAWSATGDELLFTVVKGGSTELRGVTRSAQQRVITQTAGEWTLQDVSRDGRFLLTEDHKRGQIIGLAPGDTRERDLSWLDRSVAVDLSADGGTLLLSEIGAAGGESRAVYLRRMDGSPAVKLGQGEAEALSPDGKWAIANQGFAPERLVLLPTGTGEARPLKNGAITDYYRVRWLPDGRHIVFGALEPGHEMRTYIQDTEGDPHAVTWKGAVPSAVFLNDGKTYVARGAGRRYYVFDTTDGNPRPVPGLTESDFVIQASADGRSLFVLHAEGVVEKVDRLNLLTARRGLWKQVVIPDPAGVMHIGPEFPAFLVTPDGRAYAYNYLRVLSDLFLVDGLR